MDRINVLIARDSKGQLMHLVESQFQRMTKLFKELEKQALSEGGTCVIYRNVPDMGLATLDLIPMYWPVA